MFRTARRLLARYGRWPRLVLAALCVLAAIGSATTAGRGGRSAGTVPVFLARRALPTGKVLSGHDLVVARWPVAVAPAGARLASRAVVGRRLAAPLAAGEPVTADRLLGRDLVTGLRPGQLAVAVPLADAHAAVLLHAGDRVDLLAVARSDGFSDGTTSAATASVPPATVASSVLVLALLPNSTADPTAAGVGTEIVVATDRPTALRIARAAQTQDLAALAEPP